ncbi:putative allergen Asp F4-like [Aspergillus mulundensis]|uniref:Putative Allergen Asp F4-like n=1 Tax=Aspergillus mulundensis TaxID=1810919 RepID=A0A3D8RY16_9EURO|nr:putative Allergen Asp F4-like [Aspergillus mulundensis]RDW78925.1 putative Allergen Asp F4-like [Aspergillus mulundensis]
MKWESLILTALAAGLASARAHGLHGHGHKDVHRHQKKDSGVNTKTVVQWDVVTVYTTVTLDAAATATIADVDVSAETSISTSTSSASTSDSDALVEGTVAVSIGDSPVDSASVTTTTTISTTTTATITTSTTASSTSTSTSSSDWSSTPSSGTFSTTGFGTRTNSSSSSGITYTGNVGSPWGSNIIEVSSSSASSYKYVLQFTLPANTSSSSSWFISFWNKIGPDGGMDGWYGHSALNFTLAPGETRYVAIDENSQGGWGAAAGDSLPTDSYGGYACTWGEFDFGDEDNDGWSGWDVSAIQAQNADLDVQGMRICTAAGEDCSYITENAADVVNAYTAAEASVDGIGGAVGAGPVRLVVEVDYRG